MTAEDISADISTAIDVTPNLGLMMDVIKITCTENDDWIQMTNYGYTTVYQAFATVANAVEACTIADDTKVVFGAGGTDAITVLVIGV